MAKTSKKKLPKSLIVAGQKIKIEVVESKDLTEDFGEFISTTKTIKINSKYPIETQRQTLFHELIHASLYLSGHSETLGDKREESIVISLENALWPIIRLAT